MSTRTATLPREVDPRRLRRRALQVVALIGALILVVALAPGLGKVRDELAGAQPGWLAVGIVLEALSSICYVLMFRPIFCPRMSWRTAWEIGLAEVGMGSIVPASGAGGLALGAWVLSRRGMSADRIARRSVAFFLIKSSVNFVAVAVLGALLAVGLLGPDLSLALTALPAAVATCLIAAVLLLPRLGPGADPPPGAGRIRRGSSAARRSLIKGTAEAVMLVRSGDRVLLAGAIGYWAFDNAAL